MDESQVQKAHTFDGEISGGTLDGSPMVVTAWKPNAAELEVLNAGGPVFLTFIGGLPPHRVSVLFETAIQPA